MIPLQRASLPDQVATRLREGITSGHWSRELPSEAELCRELQVSRVTLRKAITQLVRERWLAPGGRGRHHRIRKREPIREASAGHIVRVLTPYSLAGMGVTNHVLLDHLSERLGPAGYRLEFEYRPALFTRHSPKELIRLNSLPDTAAWVLFFATEPMQRWFAACGRPSLVMGYPYPGVELPCVLLDGPAMARHAVGLFYQRGHREMVYFIANLTSRADVLSSEEFVNEAQSLGAHARIVSYAPDISTLRRTVDTVLSSTPRPTAYFSTSPESCLTIHGHLIQRGVRLPSDAALIAGLADSFLPYTVPTIACYHFDAALLGRRAAERVLDILKHGPGKLGTVRILPKFIPGETLGPLQSALQEAAPSSRSGSNRRASVR